MKALPTPHNEIQKLLEQPISIQKREPVLGLTIDGETSKDLDDAIWIEPTRSGAIISVHVADITDLIPLGSTLEDNALSQVETRYLASKTIPMFPPQLSEDKLSLLEGQLRLTVTIQLTLDNSANLKKTELLLTHLTSLKQFSYTSADATLNDPSQPLFQVLRYCELWAQKLAWKRKSLGAIGQTTVGAVTFDEEGQLSTTPLYRSQQIIQEFMILANTAVASLAEMNQLPLLYRNHTASAIAPKSQELIQALTTLGLPELIRQKLQSWLNPATYSPAVIGHFALSLSAYTHFTSPIRRVADYVNHRILKAVFVENKPSPYSVEELKEIADHINEKRLEVKEKRNAHFQEKQLKETAKTLENQGFFSSLSGKEFSRILKDSLKLSKLDQLVPVAQHRLRNRELSPVDLYYLIWGNYQDLSKRTVILDEVVNYLQEQPHTATQILQIGATMSQCSVDYLEKLTESNQFAFWTIFEGKTTAKPAIALNKQTAKHDANRFWLQAKLEENLVASDQIDERELEDLDIPSASELMPVPDVVVEEIDLTGIPQEARDFPIAYLHQKLQALGFKKPAYFYDKVNGQWRCCCTLKWFDQIIVETEALAQTKKEAKTQASLKAIPSLVGLKQI